MVGPLAEWMVDQSGFRWVDGRAASTVDLKAALKVD
jgi:hypothetical protein